MKTKPLKYVFYHYFVCKELMTIFRKKHNSGMGFYYIKLIMNSNSL